jgi:hypothetical protein
VAPRRTSTGKSYVLTVIVRKPNRKKKKGECKMEQVKGQCVKVQTTADECVRVTIDIDTSLIPEAVNVLKWKNNMVLIQVIEEV